MRVTKTRRRSQGRTLEIQSRETKPKQQQEDIIYRTKNNNKKTKEGGNHRFGTTKLFSLFGFRGHLLPLLDPGFLFYSPATANRKLFQRVEPSEEARQARDCM